MEGLEFTGKRIVLVLGDGMKDVLKFTAYSMEIAIVMMIDAKAMIFSIAKYDVSTCGHG